MSGAESRRPKTRVQSVRGWASFPPTPFHRLARQHAKDTGREGEQPLSPAMLAPATRARGEQTSGGSGWGAEAGRGAGGTRSLRLLLHRKDAWILWQTVTGGSRGAEDGRPRVMPGDRRPEPPQRGVLAVLGTAGAEASDGCSPGDPVATHTCAQLPGSKHPVSARRAAQGCSAGSGGAGRDRTRWQGRRRRETLFWVRLLRSPQCGAQQPSASPLTRRPARRVRPARPQMPAWGLPGGPLCGISTCMVCSPR